jgi:sporulation protein Cse60
MRRAALPFKDHPNLDKEATTMDRRLKMKVKIFERSGEPDRLEREINDFLATLGTGAVLNTQTAIATVRKENEQIETECVVTIWYE